MEHLTPELQQLLNSALIWAVSSMTAIAIFLFGAIGILLKFIAKQFITAANKWREDLTNDTKELADELKEIAVAFEAGLDRVAEAVSANRKEYENQLGKQSERIAIIETKLEPVDNLYHECRGLKNRIDLVEQRMPKIACGKERGAE